MRLRVSKFKNSKEEVDGIVFHSKKEAARYRQLKILVSVKQITGLVLQPRFKLKINDILICTYVADFMYMDSQNREVVEDVKGYPTPIFKLKAKMFKALYPQYHFILT